MKNKILPSIYCLLLIILNASLSFAEPSLYKRSSTGHSALSKLTVPGESFTVRPGTTYGSAVTGHNSPAGRVDMDSVPKPQIIISLYGVNTDNSTYMADGAIVIYDDSYSNNVDNQDGLKLANNAENLGILTHNTLLVVERRHTIVSRDTIFLSLTGTRSQDYRFDIETSQLDNGILTGVLQDSYLHTSQPIGLDGSTMANISVTGVAGSFAPDRFRIVFAPMFTLPVSFTSVKAYSKNNDIMVEWNTANENNLRNYAVEKSTDGNIYSSVHSIAATNGMMNNYSFIDEKATPGNNFYRIKSTDNSGNTDLSKVVKVFISKDKGSVTVYPNPTTNGIIHLQFMNEPVGIYDVRLRDKSGRVLLSQEVNNSKGSDIHLIDIRRVTEHGIYLLEVARRGGEKTNIDIIY
jgi:hypothetical protein